MSIYLLAVPKKKLRSTVSDDLAEHNSELLRRCFQKYRSLVSDHYRSETKVSTPGQHGTASIGVWKRKNESNRVVAKKDWWAHSSGQDVSELLLEKVSRRGGEVVYTDPVWGSYTAIWGERYRDRVILWNTIPALEAVHYAETEDYVFASNRPLLAAVARAEGEASPVALETDFLDQYLMFGFNLDAVSPFEGVSTIAVDEALEVNSGEVKIIPRPAGLIANLPNLHSEEEAAEALADALKASTQRALANFSGKNVQVRMSGGKDSRLLLGLVKDSEQSVYGVTFGKPNDEEVRVAHNLCRAAKKNLEVTAPSPVDRSSLAEKVDRTILMSDGIPASEPHTSIYYGSSPRVAGDAIMLGQWPLMKGGQAKKLHYSGSGLQNALRRQAGWFVNEGIRAQYAYFLEQWQREVETSIDLEYLYLFARNFRSGRWLHAHINLYERDAVIAYPIADEEVAAISDAMTMSEKVSQRVLFRALEMIWPEANRIPLSNGNKWRFESAGPAENLGEDSFAERYAEVPAHESDEFLQVDPRLKDSKAIEYTKAVAVQMAKELVESANWDLLISKVTPEFGKILEAAANGELIVPEKSSQREIVKFIWRLYVADRWLRKEWLAAKDD